MSGREPSQPEMRVLVLLPSHKDGRMCEQVLTHAGLDCMLCASLPEVCREFLAGAGVIVVTEEMLLPRGSAEFVGVLSNQPRWSDIPVIVLMQGNIESPAAAPVLEKIDNVVLLTRPIQVNGLLSPVRSALRARLRQYQVRDYLAERERKEKELRQAKEELASTNADLEKKVQERTAKLQELVGDLEHFSYTLTHDMRAPLRALSMFAQMAVEGECAGCDQSTSKDYLKRIEKSAKRMDELIKDALQYAKAVRGELSLKPVDVAKLVGSMIQSYPNLQPSQADICLEGELPPVLGNEAALTQCFSNLLGNAVKFVAPGVRPKVRVWAERANDYVRTWVEDNGIGIPENSKARIFDMFYRGTPTYEGTGIGLALVRKNVEKMGGRIGVESEPGKGSRFWLELKLGAD